VTRIGLNLLYIEPGRTGGMEIYARALVPELVRQWPQVEWVIFAGNELAAEDAWPDGVNVVRVPVCSSTRFRRVAAEQFLLPLQMSRHKIDLLHSLGTTTPLLTTRRTVVTIHDVIYKRFPDAHAGILTKGMALLVPAAARRARRVLADSKAGAEDLQDYLKVPAAKIDVAPLGPGIAMQPAPTPEKELRERLGLGDGRLVLSVSARRPHKNLPRLIEAMRGLDATLVLPGYDTAFDDELRAAAHSDRVVFAGWVDHADLEGLYAAAEVMAFPSLAEGFGLPVLEAMRRGLPVASSNATSLPELVGDAGLLFDPTDTAAMRGAIESLLGDEQLRRDLAKRGPERAELFSWEKTAQLTLASYEKALA
jgi:glycosyltransferase involved in cell wall biosynthesis